MNRYLLPAGIFMLLVILLAIGLSRDPRKVASPLIGKPAPAFSAPTLLDKNRTIDSRYFMGKVTVINVFASWCAACKIEHPLLIEFAKGRGINLVGLNYKNQRSRAIRWLETLGNPYQVIIYDRSGRIGIDWGVYGVPETFVVDKQGIIRHKHIGPVTVDALKNTIIPLIRKLEAES